MSRRLVLALIALTGLSLLIMACQPPTQDAGPAPTLTSPPPEQIANPASVYCVDQRYQLEIREDEQGNQYGVCIFPDGTECEEWAYFRGECAPGTPAANIGLANPASVYCEEQGNRLEIREDEQGNQYGMCIFPDGTECEEWAYFRGECAPGTPAP